MFLIFKYGMGKRCNVKATLALSKTRNLTRSKRKEICLN
jgi:hypothetical protein